MSRYLLDEECNFSYSLDFEHESPSSIIDYLDVDCSLTTNDPVQIPIKATDLSTPSIQTSKERLPSDSSSCINPNNKLDSNILKDKLNKWYYEHFKPSCTDLEFSYSELFTDPHPRRKDFAKAFVAKRIQLLVDKANLHKKSSSCSNLPNLSQSGDSQLPSTDINTTFLCNETYRTNNLNSSKLPSVVRESSLNRFTSGSVEVLNCTYNTGAGTKSNTKLNETYVAPEVNTTFRLQKSFSASCLPDKNESLIDVEMKLEDSVPSEDEVDEMGLPIKKLIFNYTPTKKNSDISQTIKKFRNIVRASFGEPSDNVHDDVKPATIAAPVKATPLISEVHDTHLKKSQATSSKGPMKALMPLQTMTKHIGAKIVSPFKKKLNKKIDIHSKSSGSSVSVEPLAASTPTGGSSRSRDSTQNTSLIRSVSEGRMTPVKKNPGQILNNSNSMSFNPCGSKINTATTTSNKVVKTSKSSTINIDDKLTLNSKPKLKNSFGRRPSTAPLNLCTSSKAPLKTNLTSHQSTSKLTNGQKLNLNYNKPVRSSLVTPSSFLGPLKNHINSLKKPSIVPKPLRPKKTGDKENKLKT